VNLTQIVFNSFFLVLPLGGGVYINEEIKQSLAAKVRTCAIRGQGSRYRIIYIQGTSSFFFFYLSWWIIGKVRYYIFGLNTFLVLEF
jgi:hypothetical protein